MRTNHKGWVLTEALAAVVIMALALMPVAQSLLLSYRSTMLERDYTQALFLLRNQLELYLRPGAAQPADLDQACPEPFNKFRYKFSLNKSSDEKKTLQLRAAVSWPSGSKTRDIAVTMLLPKVEESDAVQR